MQTPDRNGAVSDGPASAPSSLAADPSSTRPAGGSRRTAWIVVIAAVVVAAAIALIAFRPWSGDASAGDPVRIDRGTEDEASLTIDGSARLLTITADAPSANLLTADAASGAQPSAEGPGTLHLGDGNEVHLRLVPGVAWTINVASGLDTLTADLSAGSLSGLTLAAGARQIELTLPTPDGTATIDQPGGAQDLTIHLPRDVGAQVEVPSGIGTATIDGTKKQGVGSGTTLTTDPVGDSSYAVKIGGGLSTLTIDHP